MRSKLKAFAAGVVLLALSAPVTASGQGKASGAPQTRFDELKPQYLDPGRCGLFLWVRGEKPVFTLVAFDVPNAAYMRTNGRDRVLPRTKFEGERAFGQFERQTFTDGRLTVALELTFDEKRRMQDGVVVDHGTLRAKDGEGWETVMPVGGMVACRNT